MVTYYFELSPNCFLKCTGNDYWHCLERTKSFIDCSNCKFYTEKPKDGWTVLDIG